MIPITPVRLHVSLAIVGLLLLHAFAGSVMNATVTPRVKQMVGEQNCDCRDCIHQPGCEYEPVRRVDLKSIEKLPEPAMTSPRSEQEEMKGGSCVSCRQPFSYAVPNYAQPNYVQPNYQPISYVQPIESQQVTSLAAVYGAVFNRTANGWYYATLNDPTSVWVSTGQRSTHAFPGTFDTAAARILAEMTQGARTLGPQVSTTIHNSGSATLPAPKRFDLALFLDNSPRSQQIARWFDTDEQLSWIKSRCNFQVYTPDNPTYRTRLASVVGVENFPAVVLTFADGGHIHAAAEKMIPSTSSKLADDLYYYTTLATKAREQSKSSGLTGVIKTASYNWDKSINPSMQLREADLGSDCDDGSCDRNNRPHFPSGGSEGEGLLDRARDHAGRNAVVWTGLGDEAILGLIVIVVIVAVIARRQGKI